MPGIIFLRLIKNPAGMYLFKINNEDIRTLCEMRSKLTIKTPERCQWRHSGVSFVNFEQIPHIFVVFLLLTFNE